jgi:uncharacterized protein
VTRNSADDGFRRAEDLGPSGFDPHAPYSPVDPNLLHSANSPDNQDRNLAILAHLSGCLGFVVGSVPGFLGPLILWLFQKDRSPFVEQEAREALNFQITLLILAFICAAIALMSCGTLFIVIFVPVVLQIVFGIIATLSAANGKPYRYPFNLRLIK